MSFDADQYWSSREFKKWVVYVTKCRGYGRAVKQETRYVRARTREGACRTAIFYSTFTGQVTAVARLANPWDIGCHPSGEPS